MKCHCFESVWTWLHGWLQINTRTIVDLSTLGAARITADITKNCLICRWDNSCISEGLTSYVKSARMFAFVARKIGSRTDNACHVFAELEPEQPASAVVNFITKVMMGRKWFARQLAGQDYFPNEWLIYYQRSAQFHRVLRKWLFGWRRCTSSILEKHVFITVTLSCLIVTILLCCWVKCRLFKRTRPHLI